MILKNDRKNDKNNNMLQRKSHIQFKEGKKRPTAILNSWHEVAQVEANSFFSFKLK